MFYFDRAHTRRSVARARTYLARVPKIFQQYDLYFVKFKIVSDGIWFCEASGDNVKKKKHNFFPNNGCIWP